MTRPVQLFGKMLAFSRLQINCPLEMLDKAMTDALAHNERVVPVVIESDLDLDLERVIDILWAHKVAVIGVMAGALSDAAQARKLAVFPSDGKRIERLSSIDDTAGTTNTAKITAALTQQNHSIDKNNDHPATQESDKQAQLPHFEAPPLSTLSQSTSSGEQARLSSKGSAVLSAGASPLDGLFEKTHKIHRQMVRSGQALHHIGGDLIVVASVNKGAEVATDYNLHIYGKGQGRLVAGATGDENAHIFCQNFDPSLVSVAGTYCLNEDIPREMIGKAVQVSFVKDKGLIFTLIGA